MSKVKRVALSGVKSGTCVVCGLVTQRVRGFHALYGLTIDYATALADVRERMRLWHATPLQHQRCEPVFIVSTRGGVRLARGLGKKGSAT